MNQDPVVHARAMCAVNGAHDKELVGISGFMWQGQGARGPEKEQWQRCWAICGGGRGGGEDKCRWGRSTRLRRAGHKWEGVGSYGRQVLTDWLIIVVATNQH